MPAETAAWCPKLRLRCRATTCRSRAIRASMRPAVPSRLPSSTRRISYGSSRDRRTASSLRCSSARFSCSLKSGTTTLITGAGSVGRAEALMAPCAGDPEAGPRRRDRVPPTPGPKQVLEELQGRSRVIDQPVFPAHVIHVPEAADPLDPGHVAQLGDDPGGPRVPPGDERGELLEEPVLELDPGHLGIASQDQPLVPAAREGHQGTSTRRFRQRKSA